MEWPTLWGEAVDQVPINNLIPTLNEQLFLCQPLVTRKRHFNQSLEWHRLAILFGRRKMPLLYCIDGSLVQVWIEPTNNLHLINFALVIDCDR
jgi:hypothetical protein